MDYLLSGNQTGVIDAPARQARQRASRLRIERLDLLHDQVPTSLVASVLVGGILVLALAARNVPGAALTYWYLSVVVLSGCRLVVLRAYHRAEITAANTGTWFFVLALSVAISGMLWGSAIFLASPADELQVMTTLLILAGMASGSAMVYAASMPILIGFNLPLAVIVFAGLIPHPELGNLLSLVTFYFGVVLVAGSRSCRAVFESLCLRIENYELIEELRAEKRRIGKLNVELESRVAQRTEQLLRSNRRLREEIHEKDQAERALANSESLYRSLYHANPSLFITINACGSIESVNDYGLTFLGYSRDQLIGKPVSMLSDESSARENSARFQRCLQHVSRVQKWKGTFILSTGATIRVRILARAVRDENGALRLHLVCEDITQAQELERRLAFQASHDPLTSLYNRREFEKRLQHVLSNRRDQISNYVLCCMDLDKFKIINDTCGHAAGDELLRRLGATLERYIRGDDTLARLGGDEFGILMKNTSLDDACKLVERLREAVDDFTFQWELKRFHVSASFGLAEIPAQNATPADVLRDADKACYAAKKSGRNQIRVHLGIDQIIAPRKTGRSVADHSSRPVSGPQTKPASGA